jgi:hypothetical protein
MSTLVRIGGVAAVLAIGCTDRMPTSELSAFVRATIEEHALHVGVSIRETVYDTDLDDGYDYIIDADEHVLVEFRGQVVDVLFGTAYRGHPYSAMFALDGDVAADELIRVTLERDGTSASFLATPPSPFALDIPETPSASEDFVLHWSPTSNDPMKWNAYGCQFRPLGEGPVPDTGELTFPRSVLFDGSACDLELRVMRTRKTRPASDFRGAFVEVTQQRTAEITFTR